ncbi:MAG: hypothetical protein JNJ52_08080 [Flavobacterium sp.]|nr:hypothetical protein [Flavobacterium sp.]
MKKIHLIVVLIVCIFANVIQAQAPQKMSYQAVIRNNSNVLVTSATVGMRISILQGTMLGPSVYTETQTLSTNANGLVSLEIGTGVVVSGSFSTINWANGPYFIKTETDPTGGTNYTISGTVQLSSVPYALFAANAGGSETPGTAVGDMKYWNGTSWVMIPVGTPGQFLQLNPSNIPSWSGGAFATLTLDPIPNQVANFANFQNTSGTITNTGLTAAGGSAYVEAGFCWSTNPNPTVADNQSVFSVSAPVGNYVGIVHSLLPSTTYYVRAFARNSAGVSYSNQQSFTTFTPTLPTVTTSAITNITGGTADGGGTVTNDGGAAVTQKGLCWSTSPNPTIADSFTNNGFGTGTFTSIMYGLVPNTTYYVRAYATNVAGTAYGNQQTFTAGPNLAIGSFHQGGLIAYFLQPSDPGYVGPNLNGIIISPNVVGTGVQWGCIGTLISGASGNTIGSGAQNTTDIVTGCTSPGIAAQLCDNLVLNGYSDWFLPSNADWIAMCSGTAISNNVISNVTGYWTSNQVDANTANIIFNNYPSYTGYIGNVTKNDTNSYGGYVRAIRMF